MMMGLEFPRAGQSKFPNNACLNAPYLGFAIQSYIKVNTVGPEQSLIATNGHAWLIRLRKSEAPIG
jgi:hypothetical protein